MGYFTYSGNIVTVTGNNGHTYNDIVLDNIVCDDATIGDRFINNNCNYEIPDIPPCHYDPLPNSFSTPIVTIVINGVTYTSPNGTYNTIDSVLTWLNSLGLGTFTSVGQVISVTGSNTYGTLTLQGQICSHLTAQLIYISKYAEYILPNSINVNGVSVVIGGVTYSNGANYTNIEQIVGWLNSIGNIGRKSVNLINSTTISVETSSIPIALSIGNLTIDTLGIPQIIVPSNVSPDVVGVCNYTYPSIFPTTGASTITRQYGQSPFTTITGILGAANITQFVANLNLLNVGRFSNTGTINARKYTWNLNGAVLTFPYAIGNAYITINGINYPNPNILNGWDDVRIWLNGLGFGNFTVWNQGNRIDYNTNNGGVLIQWIQFASIGYSGLGNSAGLPIGALTDITACSGITQSFAVSCGFSGMSIVIDGVTHTDNSTITSIEQIQQFISYWLLQHVAYGETTINGNEINCIGNASNNLLFGNLVLNTLGTPITVSTSGCSFANSAISWDVSGFTFPLLTFEFFINGNPITFTNVADITALVGLLNQTNTGLYSHVGNIIYCRTFAGSVIINQPFPYNNFSIVINGNTLTSLNPLNNWFEVLTYLNSLGLGFFYEYNNTLFVVDETGQNTYGNVSANSWTSSILGDVFNGSLDILGDMTGCWATSTVLTDTCHINSQSS